jgi:hypothetical protein
MLESFTYTFKSGKLLSILMVKSAPLVTNFHVQHGSEVATPLVDSTIISAKGLEHTKLTVKSASLLCSTILTSPFSGIPLYVQYSRSKSGRGPSDLISMISSLLLLLQELLYLITSNSIYHYICHIALERPFQALRNQE